MQTSPDQSRMSPTRTDKKSGGVDKGTTRKTPGNNKGARPPKEEDFDKIHEENQRRKKSAKKATKTATN